MIPEIRIVLATVKICQSLAYDAPSVCLHERVKERKGERATTGNEHSRIRVVREKRKRRKRERDRENRSTITNLPSEWFKTSDQAAGSSGEKRRCTGDEL